MPDRKPKTVTAEERALAAAEKKAEADKKREEAATGKVVLRTA